jgi:protein SCO1/2
MGRARRFLVWVALLLLAAACSQPQADFKSIDITGAEYAHDFALRDPSGKPRTLADFKDKAVLIFFGYTQCPDVCPTTMLQLSNVMQALGKDADRVQVLFVTVDPERDTPELLAAYVPSFDKRFLGLYGDAEATVKVAKEFKVFYQKVPGSTATSYTVDHTSGSYIFDPQGRIRLVTRPGESTEDLTHDLKILLG